MTFFSRPLQLLSLLNTTGLSPGTSLHLWMFKSIIPLFHINLASCSLSLIMTRITLDLLHHRESFLPLLLSPSLFFILISFLFSFLLMLYPFGSLSADSSALLFFLHPHLKAKSFQTSALSEHSQDWPDSCHWKGVALISSKHSTLPRHCVYTASLCAIFQGGYFRFLSFLTLLTLIHPLSLLAANLARGSQRKQKQKSFLNSCHQISDLTLSTSAVSSVLLFQWEMCLLQGCFSSLLSASQCILLMSSRTASLIVFSLYILNLPYGFVNINIWQAQFSPFLINNPSLGQWHHCSDHLQLLCGLYFSQICFLFKHKGHHFNFLI